MGPDHPLGTSYFGIRLEIKGERTWDFEPSESELVFTNDNGSTPLILNKLGDAYFQNNIGIGVPSSTAYTARIAIEGPFSQAIQLHSLSGSTSQLRLLTNGSTQESQLQFTGTFKFFEFNGTSPLMMITNDGKIGINTQPAEMFHLDNGTALFTTEPKVGINTTDPRGLLHVHDGYSLV
ncbi:MAG: hypothetical protein H0X62_13705 [Bacteroidetes bacterium]|nr:hypothetical protein [Bacteroidota bacterium]